MSAVLRDVSIVNPVDAAELGVEEIGGKAKGLLRLQSAGANVPAWLVLPAGLFAAHLQRALDAPGLGDELVSMWSDSRSAEDRASLEGTAERLRRAIEATPLADDVTQAIAAAIAQLGNGSLAVRSSMVGEDSARHSYAGQFDTVLNVQGAAEARAAVLRCWSSAFTARSLIYRREIGASSGPPRMAVILQRMVAGDVSGVMFTINPVNGRDDEALISSVRGLGDTLVSGEADADEYVVRADGIEIGGADLHRTSLSSERLAQVHREGMRIARAMGGPLDLEWTIDGDTLFMLQERPVTSTVHTRPVSGRDADSTTGERILWDNSNIQESYCGVTTPLTFSFAARAYASVYEQTMRVLSLPESVIERHRPMLRSLLGLIHGRVYYNINNWYRGLLLLPSFGRNKADMERMMGLEEPADIVVDDRPSRMERLRRLPRLALTLVRLLMAIRRLESTVPAFMAEFERNAAAFDRTAVARETLPELMERLRWLRARFVDRWHIPILNDFRVMMAAGKLRRIVERAVGIRADAAYHAVLGGVEGLESAAPTHWLMRIAATARENPGLVERLKHEPLPTLDELRVDYAAIAAELSRYVEMYGDRCIGELKLETVSHRENPAFLIQVIRNFLDHPSLDAERLAESERQARTSAEREVEHALGMVDRWRFRRALRSARDGIGARERMRLARTRLFGMYRDTYRAIGARLHERGMLANARDVFYLTVGEIEGWHDGMNACDLARLVESRRLEFQAYEHEELPNRLETRDGTIVEQKPAAAVAADVRVLRGTACCAGIVDAPIRVIMAASDDLDIRGRILTTLRTDPGWAPLFPSAAGILVERGSTLSHSAVLARELGIPAIVGIPGLLKRVHDGDRVRMDGSAGIVELLERR